jgi:hypothetical protein
VKDPLKHRGRADTVNRYAWRPERVESSWGLPVVEASTVEPPETWVNCWQWHARPTPGDGVQFYVDDYRFEKWWSRPEANARRLEGAGAVLTPDFSVWLDDLRPVQLWNVYRARWLGAYWQSLGLPAIPSLTWGDVDSWAFTFAGLEPGGVYAVATSRLDRSALERRLFLGGYAEAVERLEPALVLVFGSVELPSIVTDLAPIRLCDGTAERRAMAARCKAAAAVVEGQQVIV